MKKIIITSLTLAFVGLLSSSLIAPQPAAAVRHSADPIEDYFKEFCNCLELLPEKYWQTFEDGSIPDFTEEEQAALVEGGDCMQALEASELTAKMNELKPTKEEIITRINESSCGDKAALLLGLE